MKFTMRQGCSVLISFGDMSDYGSFEPFFKILVDTSDELTHRISEYVNSFREYKELNNLTQLSFFNLVLGNGDCTVAHVIEFRDGRVCPEVHNCSVSSDKLVRMCCSFPMSDEDFIEMIVSYIFDNIDMSRLSTYLDSSVHI